MQDDKLYIISARRVKFWEVKECAFRYRGACSSSLLAP